MASVHPSRLGLVPIEAAPPRPAPSQKPSREDDLKRKLKERRSRDERERESGHGRSRDRSREREKLRDRSRDRERDHGRERDRDDRQRGERSDRRRDERDDRREKDSRRRSSERDWDRRETRPSPPRRASPSYAPAPAQSFVPPTGHAMPPFPGHAMPPFAGRGAPGSYASQGGWSGGGGAHMNNLDQRRIQRDNMQLSIWPPSPKEPYRDEEEVAADRKAAKAAAKAARRARKEARKASKLSRSKRRYSESISSSSDDEREREKRSRSSRSPSKRARLAEEEEDAWVVKEARVKVPTPLVIPPPVRGDDDESDDEIGPALPKEIQERNARYGGKAYTNMLPGEAAAMAAFAASGERIPRRGEIGLETEDIEKFENSGYVMSGSRHRRMNAVRLRKENQVISAEEKRGILKLQREQQTKKEALIIGSFKEILEDKMTKVEGAD